MPTDLTDDMMMEETQVPPGTLAPVIVTREKVWLTESENEDEVLSTERGNILKSLFEACSLTDQVARRWQVLRTWKARSFDRGDQYLMTDKSMGGWTIAGTNTSGSDGLKGNPFGAQDDAGLYATNIYSAQGDITTAALCRGQIKLNFAALSKHPADIQTADECNQYKLLWQKHCEAENLQRDTAASAWTDCRSIYWTRSVADATKFGVKDDGSPNVVSITTAFGVLESKTPMMVDSAEDMSFLMLFEDIDYTIARAMFPKLGKRIKASWSSFGQMELERLARIVTRTGTSARYTGGNNTMRECTMTYGWLRPCWFYDDLVPETETGWFLENFPKGVFIVMAGTELCCCWNESMDDHIALGMFTRGFGQNRRALGSSDIPIQERTNIWVDLADKYMRKTIPFLMYRHDSINPEALSNAESMPGTSIPVVVQEGGTIQDVTAASASITPQDIMLQMTQWFAGPLLQAIDGATPALMGQAEGNDDTVGATQIRLAQSLERVGPPYVVIGKMHAKACEQAAKCFGENSDDEITDFIDGSGHVSANPGKMRGNARCVAEVSNGIPESGAQREAKLMQILDMANASPQLASLIGSPSNARAIVNGLGMDDVLSIDEADSEDKQLEEIERLINESPILNPAYAQMQQQISMETMAHEALKREALENKEQLTAEEIDKGEAIEKQIASMQQQLQKIPQFLPSVPVATSDDPFSPDHFSTEDHATEAAMCFTWAQQQDGRSMKASTNPKDKEHYLNFSLHWALHRQMAEKMAAQQQIQPKTSISIAADKLSGSAQAQALEKAGIEISPQDADSPHEQETETIQRTPMAEIKNTVRKRL